MTSPRRPNVYTVAERAGVSIATVSRVLSGGERVAPDTRRRVLDAIEALQWRPNRLARALAQRGGEAVAIVFTDLSGLYYAQVINGFEQHTIERRAAVLVLGTHGRDDSERLVLDLAERVDGLVVMGGTVPDVAVAALEASRVPLVLLARPPVGSAPAIRADNRRSAVELAAHLLAHGRRRLVFLGDPGSSPDGAERWEGLVEACAAAGLPRPATVATDGFEPEHGHKALLRELEAGTEFDAVFCVNDQVASGAIRAAGSFGLEVPRDLAVTGWDDIPIAAHLVPPLTTVRQPMRELGARSAEMLFERIAGRAVPSLTLPTALITRQSCGCGVDQGG
ncbi:MAG TPA: LacI family DNA-binding transcriptional regulator [Acidimicrobiia bacterium]|nr:LacI family DNA-binding transcriptional regulator [Acidimicrobiia bacterium]